MQVSATDIFRVGSGAAGGTSRKASAFGNAGGVATTRMEQDIVAISDLARQMQARETQTGETGFVAKGSVDSTSKQATGLAGALTGETAKIFSYLSDEAKGQLERGVASGKLSVKDVEEGLKFLANQEVAIRVQRGRERSPEEIADSKEIVELRALQAQRDNVFLSFSEKYRDLDIKRISGEINDTEFAILNTKIGNEEKQLLDSDQYKGIDDRYNDLQDKANKLTMEGLMKELGGAPNEMKWQGSIEKFDSIGFDVHRNRQSFKTYAASQETPTMFRADAA